jgi:hypothetical protein
MLTRPTNTRGALFAASLARDVKEATEAIESECAALRLVAEGLIGLPRVVDVGGVARVSKEMATALFRIDDQQRKLRAVLLELKDFVR